jgi:hypothetical protein
MIDSRLSVTPPPAKELVRFSYGSGRTACQGCAPSGPDGPPPPPGEEMTGHLPLRGRKLRNYEGSLT